jgi:hypothetical protein
MSMIDIDDPSFTNYLVMGLVINFGKFTSESITIGTHVESYDTRVAEANI